MKKEATLLVVIASLALFPQKSLGDGEVVKQSGNISRGHTTFWIQNGTIADAGTATNGNISTLGITANGGYGFGIQTAQDHITAPYWQFLEGLNSTHAYIDVEPFALGSAIPLDIIIDGVTIMSIGGTNWLSNVFDAQFGSTVGDMLCRGSGGWAALTPGPSGYTLFSQGTASCPQWLTPGGGTVHPVFRQITSGNTDTATSADGTVAWDSATASPKVQTIPTCDGGAVGVALFIKDEENNGTTYPIAVTPTSGTIEHLASYLMNFSGQAIMIQCDGVSNWVVL